MVKANELFTVWSPDEAAECLKGIGNTPLYSKLWELVREYPKGPRSECNDDFADRAMVKWWDRFTPEEQATLNEAAEEQSRDQALD